ncbi:hypothetical protein L873DRAFT_1319605 [Choiromyces venosus 120613-1]|uniref:Uncharacterized protein n=1 Tax=Choiromyces venosus 120613-1 TaxID=1336337 RepID=A0A3N4JNF4_9PEZI|nr:hypothetical protein L873DRAFT_1319605 [Choiromyces venosus 120613-1]
MFFAPFPEKGMANNLGMIGGRGRDAEKGAYSLLVAVALAAKTDRTNRAPHEKKYRYFLIASWARSRE